MQERKGLLRGTGLDSAPLQTWLLSELSRFLLTPRRMGLKTPKALAVPGATGEGAGALPQGVGSCLSPELDSVTSWETGRGRCHFPSPSDPASHQRHVQAVF